jgi:hypothetical protein
MEKQFDKTFIITFVISFFGAYLLFPPYFDMHLFPMVSSPENSWLTLDPSWNITLNYVNLKEFVWGEEFVFTYGPLSYLSTRFGWGVNKMHFLLYDFFLFFNFFFIFFYTIKKATTKIFPIILVILTCLILPDFFRGANSIVLMVFLIFWIKISMLNPKWYYFLPQFVLLFLMFYIKFNTGLVSFILFYSGLLYLFFSTKINKIYLAIIGIIPFILILLTAPIFKVKLWPYIINGIEIVKGYNQIMYLDRAISDYHLFAILIILIVLFLFIKILMQEKKQNLHYNLTIFFLITSIVYVLFKQGFVRADNGHITDFYIYISLILLMSFTYFNFRFKKTLNPLLIICFVISVYFTYVKNETSIDYKSKLIKSQYINGFNIFTSTGGIKLFPNNNQFPQTIKKKIGKKTVDIFPWNSYLLFENKMNFSPRPVFQSYTAYTKKLEELNFAHYNSKKAPQFVFYDYESIDNRYPLYDEPKVNLILTKNYKVVDTFSIQNRKLLLLEKKKEFKPIKFIKSREYAMILGSSFVPQKNIYYEVEVYSSILGKLASFVHHSPKISLFFNSENEFEYKTSQSLMQTGFFLESFVKDVNDFSMIIKDEKINSDNIINFITFKPEKNILFKDKIKITEYKILN